MGLSGNGLHYPTARRVTQPGPLQKTPIYKEILRISPGRRHLRTILYTLRARCDHHPHPGCRSRPGRRHRGANARGRRFAGLSAGSIELSEKQTVRRRDQHTRPDPVSVSRIGAPAHHDASWSRVCTSKGPTVTRRSIESDGPAALMIRRVEYDALLVSLAVEAGATLVPGVDVVQARQDAERVELVARDGRRFEAPIRHRGRRREQRHRAASRTEPGLARLVCRDRHDGRNAARGAPRRRSVDALGRLRLRRAEVSRVKISSLTAVRVAAVRINVATSASGPRKATRTFFRNAITSTSASATCCRTTVDAIDAAPYELQRGSSAPPRPRRRRRRFGEAELHAVPDSGRRAPARTRTRPRAARGRRRRIRERLYGRRDLLRHGVGRAGGARHPRTRHGIRNLAQALSPRVRSRNWRRVARFRADSALPVRGPPQNCPGHLGRES